MKNQKKVLITGVSTGIGYQLAKDLLAKNYKVYGSVRRKEDAARLGGELPGLHILEFDVTDYKAIELAAKELQNLEQDGIDFLVNNAGLAVSGPLLNLPIEEFEYQFRVNVFGVMKVTQCFAPLLGAKKDFSGHPGKIIQISSVSGKLGMPFIGAYAGSKHALEGISESLRRELMIYGIDVIVIGPGAIKTPIWKKEKDKGSQFSDSDYGGALSTFQQKFIKPIVKKAIPVEDLSKSVIRVMEASRPKTRYTFSNNKLLGYWLPRYLPKRMIDRMIMGTVLGK